MEEAAAIGSSRMPELCARAPRLWSPPSPCIIQQPRASQAQTDEVLCWGLGKIMVRCQLCNPTVRICAKNIHSAFWRLGRALDATVSVTFHHSSQHLCNVQVNRERRCTPQNETQGESLASVQSFYSENRRHAGP